MSFKYRVTLKPQEPFFFGGEHTFGRDDTRDEGVRYSATSTYFPQQSAVLGMIRKTFLIQNHNLTMHLKGEWVDSRGGRRGNDSNYTEAIRMMGGDSFSYEKESDLGILESISPLFITKDSLDYVVDSKDNEYNTKSLNSKMMINGKVQETFILDGFDAKEYKDEYFIAKDRSSLSFSDIFESVQTVGIKKSQDTQSDEDGFFQKSSFLLKDKASFTFFMELSEEIAWRDAYVTLGADQSLFQLTLTPTKESFNSIADDLFEPKTTDRVILHSETLVDEKVYANALFVLGKRESYRQLKNQNGQKSKRYYLLERGSVIYTNELQKLTEALTQAHLQKVGINIFTPLKGL